MAFISDIMSWLIEYMQPLKGWIIGKLIGKQLKEENSLIDCASYLRRAANYFFQSQRDIDGHATRSILYTKAYLAFEKNEDYKPIREGNFELYENISK